MDLMIRLLADGSLLLILAISGIVVLLSLKSRWTTHLPVLIMAGLSSLLVAKVLSLLYQPAVARPFLELGVGPGAAYIDNPGFPSDHAVLATVAVAAVYALTRSRNLTLFLGTLIALMCIARVAALVHTPLDVIAGIGAGLVGMLWYKKLTN